MAARRPTRGELVTDREALQRRTIRVLFISQVLSGAGLAAGITVGGLLGEDMIGSKGFAGLPAALFTIGSALAAWLVGMLSQRSGRRPGLALGYAVGALGGAGTVAAAALDNVPLLLVSLFVYGSGSATNLQARYAGADLARADQRGRAISAVLVASTIGAVIGPNLVDATGAIAEAVGIRALAGPFMLATVAYVAGALAVQIALRPDPLLTARAWARVAADAAAVVGPAESYAARTVRLAAGVMVVTQLVMLAVMTMTPVHMRDHGHGLRAAGLVISLHIAAMFFPSLLTGRLVDRYGRRAVVAAGALALGAAGAVAALAPADSVALLALALILLGLGWNFGLIGGTALLTDAVPLERRAKTQGSVDVAISLAGAGGGLGSGFVVAASSFAALSIVGGVIGLAILPLLLATRSPPRNDPQIAAPAADIA